MTSVIVLVGAGSIGQAIARHFPKEIVFPPKEWVERGYNVQHWSIMSKAGHFAAMEQPEILAADIREFFGPHRR